MQKVIIVVLSVLAAVRCQSLDDLISTFNNKTNNNSGSATGPVINNNPSEPSPVNQTPIPSGPSGGPISPIPGLNVSVS